MNATLRISGEYERTMKMENGTDSGWFLMFDVNNDDDEGEFIYDSNTGTLFRDGYVVDYRLYQLEVVFDA